MIFLFCCLIAVCWAATTLKYDVLRQVAFEAAPSCTQGALRNGENELLLSQGGFADSKLYRVVEETGRVLQSVSIGEQFFAEGVAKRGDVIYMLTYVQGKVLTFNATTLQEIVNEPELTIQGQGWGLEYLADQDVFVKSNGSEYLVFYDAQFRALRELKVVLGQMPLKRLNELEVIKGTRFVAANLFLRDYMVLIDLETGVVAYRVYLSQFINEPTTAVDMPCGLTANGIVDNGMGKLLIFGKYFMKYAEIQLQWNETITLDTTKTTQPPYLRSASSFLSKAWVSAAVLVVATLVAGAFAQNKMPQSNDGSSNSNTHHK